MITKKISSAADRNVLLALRPADRHAVATGRPYVGQPATIPYVTDSRAAVVTKVFPSGNMIMVSLVETEESKINEAFDRGAYGLAVHDAQGILDRPIPGTEVRYTFHAASGQFRRKGQRLILGRSIERRDWRD